MAVVVLGLNYRTVPLPVLESMTVSAGRLHKALHDLAGYDYLDEVVVLSTCMRTEIYAVASKFHPAMGDMRNCLAAWSGYPPEEFSDGLYSYYDDAVTGHLFGVAAGVDSAVLGESEILSQVRRAWEAARAEHTAGPVLDALFRHAVEAGKRVRAETAIARGTTSLAHAAVELAGATVGGLGGRRVLVIGAGEMAASTTRALMAPGTGVVVEVANRTADRATDLAAAHGATAVGWGDLDEAVARADVVVSSTGAPGLVLGAAEIETAMAARADRPLLIVDMAVPRDIDPGAGAVAGVTLLDMTDLKAAAEMGAAGRRRELPAAQRILDEEASRYHEAAAQRELAPLVAALRARAEEIRLAEMERLGGRFGELDDRQARALDSLTRGIVAKLLHDPTVRVKAAAGSPRQEQLAQALRHLFDLDV